MSGKNNVNPDHYKVAGRDRPNEALRPEHVSKDLESQNARPPKKRKAAKNFIPGAAPVGESPSAEREEDERS